MRTDGRLLRMWPYFLLSLLLLLFPARLFSQNAEAPDSSLLLLMEIGPRTLTASTFAERDSLNQVFKSTLEKRLADPELREVDLSGVKNMLCLRDASNGLILCTWQILDAEFDYQRHGMLSVEVDKGEFVQTPLEDQFGGSLDEVIHKRLKPNEWFGALYYELIPVEKDRQTYYTLLGYAPNKQLNKKVVEILKIDRRGRPSFGEKLFYIEEFEDAVYRRPPMRLLLQYHPQHTASLRYFKKEEMIVMDHLSPPSEEQKGEYKVYGPDFSYDALVWEDDWWKLQEQVRFNSGQEVPIRPPADRQGNPQN